MVKYGHTPIYGHNTSGPNFLTVHDNTISCGFLPMFLWAGNLIKIFIILLDRQFDQLAIWPFKSYVNKDS